MFLTDETFLTINRVINVIYLPVVIFVNVRRHGNW